mmetsp:Transcript_16660/g.34990  ORF Transcript_16660/g.34990 Transcript_16660/m.34990 type:complete len:165 (-) Transcript_16660:478-972(-)|eukprot:CAMPEP_0171332200 /NCGR_PEP_ID=MMETSP0878-20121228/3210_1 /TAXON_ID=67004 /ORGANISM="Thalassiosira weissflogii, Strain CCMP1336" /LENGTH=164 /DNA_ID=CAMNT_0011832899 /DNA_START=31 /DNA_END=525 /DNA_ORIENTATION=-
MTAFNTRNTILFLLVLLANTTAFTPTNQRTTYTPMKRIVPSTSRKPSYCYSTTTCKKMSSGNDADSEATKLREQAAKLREEAAAAAGVSVEELTASLKNSDGTVYDDEPMLEAPRDNLSNAMKERLRREASTGLDSNQSQTNVILYVSVGVALLVLIGGQGILF